MKSLLFKYPPSLIYLIPGDQLSLVIAMNSGKILFWEMLNNRILKGHKDKGVYCTDDQMPQKLMRVNLNKQKNND